MDISVVNNLSYGDFTVKYGNVIEHCPVVAAAVWSKRPFVDVENLHRAFCEVLDDLPRSGMITMW
jgi:2-oxo-4-hydroxy-4-carboxy-5-ureidoimidazoline decarboxylase